MKIVKFKDIVVVSALIAGTSHIGMVFADTVYDSYSEFIAANTNPVYQLELRPPATGEQEVVGADFITINSATYTKPGQSLWNDGGFGQNIYYLSASEITDNNSAWQISIAGAYNAVAFNLGSYNQDTPYTAYVSINGGEYTPVTLSTLTQMAGEPFTTSVQSFVGLISTNNITSINIYGENTFELSILYPISGGFLELGEQVIDLAPSAYALRSVYNIQSAALNAGLSYDCNVFDKEGICLSTGGRYSITSSPESTSTSGLLIGSYKYDKNIRLGAWVDQNLSTNNTDGVKLGNSKPMFGVFGVWSERSDGLGYEVKVSAGYGEKDIEVTRNSANQDSAKINSRGIQSVSSYGIALDSNWIAAPYVGVKYLSVKRGSYTEGGSSALTYDTLRQETISAITGVNFSGKIDPQTFTLFSAGVEHDLEHNVGEYSATNSSFTVTHTAFNEKPQRTRLVVTAGVYYDINKMQRIGLNASHRQEAFQSTATTSALATYTVGF